MTALVRCCCVSAMRNVHHREINDVQVRMRSRRRRTCLEKDHTSSKRSLEAVGRRLLPLGNIGQESHRRLMRSARTLQGPWARRVAPKRTEAVRKPSAGSLISRAKVKVALGEGMAALQQSSCYFTCPETRFVIQTWSLAFCLQKRF